ncbi:MAG TPA: hypothetical protein PL064_01665, partial [Thermogutta sp.]|nr:hypothetical protein [Thermogutta sp.]
MALLSVTLKHCSAVLAALFCFGDMAFLVDVIAIIAREICRIQGKILLQHSPTCTGVASAKLGTRQLAVRDRRRRRLHGTRR